MVVEAPRAVAAGLSQRTVKVGTQRRDVAAVQFRQLQYLLEPSDVAGFTLGRSLV